MKTSLDIKILLRNLLVYALLAIGYLYLYGPLAEPEYRKPSTSKQFIYQQF